MSQKHSRYFSLRNLVHTVGAALNSSGSKDLIKVGELPELLSDQSFLRAEKPGLFLYASAQKVARDGGNAKDLFVSPLNAMELMEITEKLQFICTLCDSEIGGLRSFLSHIAGKPHMRSLKKAPCGLCMVPQCTVLPRQVQTALLKARQAGQILCGLISGGTEDLYSLHPDGCTAEHILENFGWISCLPCGIGFVPQRCLQDLVSHLQSDQHQQKLLLDLGLVENGHISQLLGRPRTGEVGPKQADPEGSQQELLNQGASSRKPEGCSIEFLVKEVQWFRCRPCDRSFVPTRSREQMLAHLQSLEHAQNLQRDLGGTEVTSQIVFRIRI